MKKVAIGFGGLAALGILAFAALWLAGAILFASYKQNPSGAGVLTIHRAWIQAPDAPTQRRVAGASLLAALLVLGTPFAMAMAFRRKGSDLHGSARFATVADVTKEGLHAPRGVMLGALNGKFLRLGGYEFTLLAAPTRTGKGVGFVIPNLLTFEDSVVVLDIKGENYNLTSAFRKQHLENEVYYFNPFSETTHRWNPLSYVSNNPNMRVNDLLALAALLYPENEKEPFWPSSARNLFVGLGLMVLESPELPKTFGEVLRQASGKGMDVADYLRHVIKHRVDGGNAFSSTCTDALNRFLNNSETVLKSILASLVAPLAPWANAMVDKATSADDFDLRDVRRKKMSVYLHIPAGEVMQASFIVNLFFSQLINENVKQLPEDNAGLKYQCLMMLDEFTAMGKVPIIAKGVGYMAGYNMRLAIIIQDKSQLETTYGKADAQNIVSNMGAVVYFTPSTVTESEEYSKMIGNQTVVSKSEQRSNVGALNVGKYGVSETDSYQSRAVMLPQEIRQLGRDRELVVRAGIPVIMAEKITYFSDEFFLQRLRAVPNHEVRIGEQVRMVPKPLKLPADNWLMYHSLVQRSDFYVTALPAKIDPDLPTDLLLLGINDEATPEPVRQAQIAELAKRKFDEFMQEFEDVTPASAVDAAAFESEIRSEVLQSDV